MTHSMKVNTKSKISADLQKTIDRIATKLYSEGVDAKSFSFTTVKNILRSTVAPKRCLRVWDENRVLVLKTLKSIK